MPDFEITSEVIIVLLFALLSVAVAWGVLQNRVRALFEEVESMKKSCQNFRTGCQERLCRELGELSEALKAFDAKREEARKERDQKMELISNFMGRVEQYMKDMEKRNGSR